MKIYFSADYHLDHANIIRYANRPFVKYDDLDAELEWKSDDIKYQRCREMNQTIIKNHNSIVKEGDVLYHIGDFSFNYTGKAPYWEQFLNGRIVHILGNHDKNNGVKSYITHAIMKFGGLTFYVSHKPPEQRQVDTLESHIVASCDYILCGHIHDLWKTKWIEVWNMGIKETRLAINVGLDVWDYKPISIHSILKLIGKEKWRKQNE